MPNIYNNNELFIDVHRNNVYQTSSFITMYKNCYQYLITYQIIITIVLST